MWYFKLGLHICLISLKTKFEKMVMNIIEKPEKYVSCAGSWSIWVLVWEKDVWKFLR